MKLKLIKLLAAMGILGALAGCEKEEETIIDVVEKAIGHTPGGCASDPVALQQIKDKDVTFRIGGPESETKDVGTPKK